MDLIVHTMNFIVVLRSLPVAAKFREERTSESPRRLLKVLEPSVRKATLVSLAG